MARKKVQKNISYDSEKGKYYVTLYYGKVDGKILKRTETFSTKKAARERLLQFEYDKKGDELVIPQEETVEVWLEYWIEDVMKPKIERTTYRGYKTIIGHISADLGQIPLQKLTAKRIQQYLNDKMNAEGENRISSNTAKKHLTLMRTAFKLAVQQDMLRKNPADAVESPKYVKPEISFYTAGEIRKLFSVIENDCILKPAVYLAALLGLRREEICGLKWSSIDFVNQILSVTDARTVAGSEVIEKNTKNYSSTRKLHIDNMLLEKLQEIKKGQKERRETFGDMYLINDYVEVDELGKPVNPGYLSSRFRKAIIKNELPHITLHGLRHTVASIANEAGMTQFDISKMLGHSSPDVTGKVYTHLFDDVQTKTVSKVAEFIEDNGK